MKRFDKVKTVQLIVYLIVTGYMLIRIFTDHELYASIAADSTMRFLCFLFWALLGLSYAFLLYDFDSYGNLKREYSEMDLAIFSDPMTGIANRYSCDAFIEQYMDKPLPDGIGCITFDMTNLKELNDEYGHKAGNEAIKDFSTLLQTAAINVCFVGRNGGNKFLAIFTDCSNAKMDSFLWGLEEKVERRNIKSKQGSIEYKYGKAFNEGSQVKTINDLIALSNKRSMEA